MPSPNLYGLILSSQGSSAELSDTEWSHGKTQFFITSGSRMRKDQRTYNYFACSSDDILFGPLILLIWFLPCFLFSFSSFYLYIHFLVPSSSTLVVKPERVAAIAANTSSCLWGGLPFFWAVGRRVRWHWGHDPPTTVFRTLNRMNGARVYSTRPHSVRGRSIAILSEITTVRGFRRRGTVDQ